MEHQQPMMKEPEPITICQDVLNIIIQMCTKVLVLCSLYVHVHVQDPSLLTNDGHHEVTGHHVHSSLLVVILKRTVSRDY